MTVNGIYYNPKYVDIIEEYESPSVHQVALAIAPFENMVLNKGGLSAQGPTKWIYTFDGRYIDFTFNDATIKFKAVVILAF